MVNNIGKTTKILNTQLGATTEFLTETIQIITGELGLGFLLFDPKGTLGVITSFTDTTNFTVTTHALSIDIETILKLEY